MTAISYPYRERDADEGPKDARVFNVGKNKVYASFNGKTLSPATAHLT